MRLLTLLLVALAYIVTACGGGTTSTSLMPDGSTSQAVSWQNIPLRNVRTGETFTLGDFGGRTVYVHPMARWCLNCRFSQRSLRDTVMPQVNADEVVFVSLNVDSFDSDEALAGYMTDQSFDWIFAVASNDMVNALVDAFGANVIIPPVQPHFVIYPDGSTTDLLTGNPSTDEVLALINS